MNATMTDFRDLVAFLNLLARYRDEDASIYNAMAAGYDRFAEQWDQAFARGALNALFSQIAERVPPKPTILDAGCGTGRHIQDLLARTSASKIVGADLSEPMLDMARRRNPDPRIEFVRSDLLKLPFPDNSFDAVVAIWVLETMGNPGRAVQEFLRVIKPDGVVAYTLVQIPHNSDAAEDLVGNALMHADFAVHKALHPERMPFHSCERSSLARFRHGLISTVTLGKCCSVEARMLPTEF